MREQRHAKHAPFNRPGAARVAPALERKRQVALHLRFGARCPVISTGVQPHDSSGHRRRPSSTSRRTLTCCATPVALSLRMAASIRARSRLTWVTAISRVRPGTRRWRRIGSRGFGGISEVKAIIIGSRYSRGLHHVHFEVCVGLSAVSWTHFDTDDFDCSAGPSEHSREEPAHQATHRSCPLSLYRRAVLHRLRKFC
jgi:hypothetical protein